MNGHQGHHIVEGAVHSRNDKGIKVNGQWLGLSRYKPMELPEVGTRVRAEIDNRDFLCTLEILESAPESAQSPAVVSGRDERITRLAVLKAAAGFAATRTDIKSADVLTIADRWVAWVESGSDKAS